MAGIYIHIPFCKSKCHYCNFYSLASLKNKEKLLKALLKEIELRKNYLSGKKIESIYFGGGTPSLLGISELEKILDSLHKNFDIENRAEIDFEANPDDIDREKLSAWKHLGINRLSIGTQAFDNDILQKLNRVHNSRQAIDAVNLAAENGFANISIDLIYGIPGLSMEKWEESIQTVLKLPVNHLSAYHLTVEEGTALEVLIRKKKYPQPREEEGVKHFQVLMQEMEEKGYLHYEISNFARPGKFSLHNTNYWRRKAYIGFGPSAHSYNLESRSWNIASVSRYIDALENTHAFSQEEKINEHNAYNEFVMLGLRTMWGVDSNMLESMFGRKKAAYFKSSIQPALQSKKVLKEGNIYRLSNRGKLFADGIAANCFWVED